MTTPPISIAPQQATWRWFNNGTTAKLEVFLPKRKSTGHEDVLIRARIDVVPGAASEWGVEENGVLVACGFSSSNARLEAERVITQGATGDDRARAAAYLAVITPAKETT